MSTALLTVFRSEIFYSTKLFNEDHMWSIWVSHILILTLNMIWHLRVITRGSAFWNIVNNLLLVWVDGWVLRRWSFYPFILVYIVLFIRPPRVKALKSTFTAMMFRLFQIYYIMDDFSKIRNTPPPLPPLILIMYKTVFELFKSYLTHVGFQIPFRLGVTHFSWSSSLNIFSHLYLGVMPWTTILAWAWTLRNYSILYWINLQQIKNVPAGFHFCRWLNLSLRFYLYKILIHPSMLTQC